MLKPFFNPRGVAVIGASRDPHKPGYGVVHNLAAIHYPGAIYPVNPAATRILGYPCYPSVAEVPEPVDLAVIIVAAARVAALVEQCARRGIRHIVVSSGGFAEAGPEGRAREEELARLARELGVRIMGPNCVGTIDTSTPLNVTFTAGTPLPGDLAFVSQSGALCVALMDWAQGNGIGFSRIVSLGNQVDVTETEVLAELGGDANTRVIIAYLEGVADGRAFMAAADAVARHKPLVVLKAGRAAGGAKAVMSHTGVLAGSDEAYAAAFRRCGALQAGTLEELFIWARALAWQPLPAGRRVAVLTHAGGAGVVAVDALEAAGLSPACLARETRARLRAMLPAAASVENPVDVLAGSGPAVYALALDALLADPGVDAALVIVVPQEWFLPTGLAEVIGEMASRFDKPVLASLMGSAAADQARQVLHQWHVPGFAFPEQAASALAAMARRQEWLRQPEGSALEPADLADLAARRPAARESLARCDWNGLLAAYGIRLVTTRLASSGDEAVQAALDLGFPVALKLASPDITHKSAVGGVALNLSDADTVRGAYCRIVERARTARPDAALLGAWVQPMLGGVQEVIVGVRRDAQLGPLVLVGSGGVEVELERDVALDVAPLTYAQAERLLDRTRVGTRLNGWRGAARGDRAALLDAMVRLAQLACDMPEIAELEINPLVVLPAGSGALAVDVRGALAAGRAVP
jgi:acetyl coenzyme A synthetase (ADP forming)-like protein